LTPTLTPTGGPSGRHRSALCRPVFDSDV
jgi:hypothetical protein